MATWRNIMHRKEHKERSQPIKRKRFGLLEKHKDYVKRARDFHSKQDRLQVMQRKAAMRNPDEFYFGMKNAKTKKGVHVVQKERPDATMSGDMQKLVATQDLTYAHMVTVQEKKKIEALQQNMHFLTDQGMGKHTVFVDSAKAVEAFSAADYFDTPEELTDRAYNRVRKKTLEEGTVADGTELGKGVRKKLGKAKEKAYVEMYDRQQRLEKVERLRLHLQAQKNLLAKGRRVLEKPARAGRPAVHKWKSERKK